MPKLGQKSIEQLQTCDQKIQDILNEAIKFFDFAVVKGHRGQAEQDEAFAKGFSKTKYPLSKHNVMPSRAVDIAPYVAGKGLEWNDVNLYHYMAGIVMGIAFIKGIKLRWGADWNRNNLSSDEKFLDLGHFELD